MAELVDAAASKAVAERREGSSPFWSTETFLNGSVVQMARHNGFRNRRSSGHEGSTPSRTTNRVVYQLARLPHVGCGGFGFESQLLYTNSLK